MALSRSHPKPPDLSSAVRWRDGARDPAPPLPGSDGRRHECARPRRALLAASAGGHWIELCRISAAFKGWDCQFVSTAPGMTAPLGERSVLSIPDSSRDTVAKMSGTFARLLPIVWRFDPDVVLSTGAAPGAVALMIGKLMGAHTIWIDSIANCEEVSLSGKTIRPFADVRLTQWPDLAAGDDSGLDYFGRIL